MKKYIRKRLLQAIPVVFGITLLTFFIMKMAPGGPLGGMISPRSSSEALLRAQEKLGLNKKSVAFALSFRAADRTLTDADIAAAMDKILAACRNGFGAELRS